MSISTSRVSGVLKSLFLSMPDPVIELNQEAPVADANQRVRYKLLDAWRGLAALAVVSLARSRTACWAARSKTSSRGYGLGQYLLYGALGVQFFFVISGYCIAGAAVQQLLEFGEAWPFVRARVRRIWPGYLASMLVALLLIGLHQYLKDQGAVDPVERYLQFGEMASPVWILSHLTLTQWPLHVKMLNGLYWTLCYEVAFYAIVALLLIPTWRLNRRGVLGAMHTLTIASLALLAIKPELRFFPLDLWPLFGLGVVVYDLTRHPKSVGVKLVAVAIATLTIAFVTQHSWGGGGLMLTSRVQFSAALAFAALLLLLKPLDNQLARWPIVKGLGRIGIFSYSLYLAHIPIRGIFLGAMTKSGILTPQTFWLVPTLFVPLSLALGWLFHRVFERPWLIKPPPPLDVRVR